MLPGHRVPPNSCSIPEEHDSFWASRLQGMTGDRQDPDPRWCSFPRDLHLPPSWQSPTAHKSDKLILTLGMSLFTRRMFEITKRFPFGFFSSTYLYAQVQWVCLPSTMMSSRTNYLAHHQRSHCEEAAQVHTMQKWITTHITSSFHSNHRQTEHKEVFLCQEQFSNDETGSMTLELDHCQETLKVQSALGSLIVHRISHITMLNNKIQLRRRNVTGASKRGTQRVHACQKNMREEEPRRIQQGRTTSICQNPWMVYNRTDG